MPISKYKGPPIIMTPGKVRSITDPNVLREKIANVEHRLDELECALVAMYRRGFAGDSLSLVEMAPLVERVRLLQMEVKQG